MTIIYYIEINAMCIVGLFLCMQLQQKEGQGSADNRIFRLLLAVTIVLCFADMASGILRGRTFVGALLLNGLSNTVYFISVTAVGYLWTLFVNTRLNNTNNKKILLWSIPLIFIVVVTLSNYWTGIFFSLSGENIYVRGHGIWLHWAINWMYMLVPTIQVICRMFHEKNKNKRKDLSVFLYFIIAPVITSIIQMMIYGVSCFQAGIMISLFIVFIFEQKTQILTDALTGLNNRRGFNKYCNEMMRRHEGARMFVLMIDLNGFKQINDRLSHVVGDRALQDASGALKRVCSDATHRMFLCRYGGDEFIIAGHDRNPKYEIKVAERINQEFKELNDTGGNPYTLAASIGIAVGKCTQVEDIEQLLHEADEAMYVEKKRLKELQKEEIREADRYELSRKNFSKSR